MSNSLTVNELRRGGGRPRLTPYYSMTYRYNWISNVVAPANRTFIWGVLFDLGLFRLTSFPKHLYWMFSFICGPSYLKSFVRSGVLYYLGLIARPALVCTDHVI